jgi:hypothetical protein
MLAIIATVGWILFDVYFCLRTAPDSMSVPMWWTLLIGGVGLGVVALIGEIWDRKSHNDEVRDLNSKLIDLKQGQTGHTDEIATVAKGSIAILAKLDHLAGITQTSGQSVSTTIDVAAIRLTLLESKLARIEERDWIPMDTDSKSVLASKLGVFHGHIVQVVSHENPDCQGLAEDFKDCFRKAEWHVRDVPLTGSWAASGASGIQVSGWTPTETLCRATADALHDVTRARSGVSTVIDGRPMPDEAGMPEVIVVVGTKKVHR